MPSMPAFLRFYAVFCGVCEFRTARHVLRFSAVAITPRAPGLWDSGVLGRFLCFFVSLSVRVKSRPTLPDGPDTERIHTAKRWVFAAISGEGVSVGSFCGGRAENAG